MWASPPLSTPYGERTVGKVTDRGMRTDISDIFRPRTCLYLVCDIF